jgi:hypothetical protein
MKYLKMLGLTVAAAAVVMASAGAGTASATVLCKTNTTPCAAGQMYEKGQELHATNEGEGNLITRAGFAGFECETATVKGTQENTGGASETVFYQLDETSITEEGHAQKTGLHFGKCNGTVTVASAGTLTLHWISGTMNATVTSKGTSTTFEIAGVACTYGTKGSGEETDLGVLTGSNVTGATPTMDVSAELKKEAGGLLCASPAHWEGSYKITTPDAVYVAES